MLSFLYLEEQAQPLRAISDHLAQAGMNAHELSPTIDALLHEGLLAKSGKGLLKINRHAPLYEGQVVQHPKGFGFISQVTQHGKSITLTRDPFVSSSALGTALHGDRVLIRILRIRNDDRPEAAVLRILARGSDTIAGFFQQERQNSLVYPDDIRFPFTIRIDDFNGYRPQSGEAVIVQFTREPLPARMLSGKLLEVIGCADKIDTQMRLVIEKFNLPHAFSVEVQEETAHLQNPQAIEAEREDLRQTAHITIDGETAKDFDDAICVAKTRQGFRLYVSIADVSHFVSPGSAIDQEAYLRGTSIYFPGRVVPMLPERLSNDLCSLVPDEDRLTVSAVLDFDQSGTLHKKRFVRSVIRSKQRFTYTTVQHILIDKLPAVRKQYKTFVTQLKWAQELALLLRDKRRRRGSIDFNLPEPVFTLTDDGEVSAISPMERTFAHQLIEEFMLAANEAVAGLASTSKTPAIYRVHEAPDPLKMEEFFTFAKSLGLHLPPLTDSPFWFAEVLEICKNSKLEYIVNTLLLRSMKQAQYAADNVGHFGLASPDYTHFTSPIRRYPDLIVHRILLGLVDKAAGTSQPNPSQPPLKDAGESLSAKERIAISAERDMQERLKISFMQKHLGEPFDAIISGVNDSALFLEIPAHCISGSIGIDRLTDDCYLLDGKNHRLFGEISAKTYQIGDQIRVILEDVDPLRKRLNFIPA